jgi:tetratricopeptide (TPR) repeat protein
MRRLTIAALSTLILLCVSISTPQGRGAHSIRQTPLIINMLQVRAPAAASLRSVAAPAQAPARERGATQSSQERISLEHGKPIERELAGAQSHYYKITMSSGQYLQVEAKQKGIDVVMALFTPDGKKIVEVDSNHLFGESESLSAISEMTGEYLIEARSTEKTAQTGRYEVKVEELRAATAEDKYRVAGETVFREAELLQNGTLEAKRKSVEKYYESLELYRKAGDRSGEADALNNVGAVHLSLGETRKALEKYNEALPIWREVGDRRREAITLSGIGLVYRSLGETRKALEKYNEALPIRREVGDRSGEATTLNNIGSVYHSLGEMRKALEKHDEALRLRREVGDRKGEAATINNVGQVYYALGERQKALEKFNEALRLRREVGDRNGEANTLLGIARVEQKRGNLT